MPRWPTPETVLPVRASRAWLLVKPVWYQTASATAEPLLSIVLLDTVAARMEPAPEPALLARKTLTAAPPAARLVSKSLPSTVPVRLPEPPWTSSTPTKFESNVLPVTSRSSVAVPVVAPCRPSMRLPSKVTSSNVAVTDDVPPAATRAPWLPVVEAVSLNVEPDTWTVTDPLVEAMARLSSIEPVTVVSVMVTTPAGFSREMPDAGDSALAPFPDSVRSSRVGLVVPVPQIPLPDALLTAM